MAYYTNNLGELTMQPEYAFIGGILFILICWFVGTLINKQYQKESKQRNENTPDWRKKQIKEDKEHPYEVKY